MEENKAHAQAQVTFTHEVMQSLAFKSKDVVLKFGLYRLPAVIQKASFNQLLVVVPGMSFIRRIGESHDATEVSLRFSRQDENGKISLMELKGDIQSIDEHPDDSMYAMLSIALSDESKVLFTPLLGSFINHVQIAQQEATTWFKITAMSRDISHLSRRHCTLTKAEGTVKRCFVQALSMKGVILLLHSQNAIGLGEAVRVNLVFGGRDLVTSLLGMVEAVDPWELSPDLMRVKIIYQAEQTSIYYHDIIGKMIAVGAEQYENDSWVSH